MDTTYLLPLCLVFRAIPQVPSTIAHFARMLPHSNRHWRSHDEARPTLLLHGHDPLVVCHALGSTGVGDFQLSLPNALERR